MTREAECPAWCERHPYPFTDYGEGPVGFHQSARYAELTDVEDRDGPVSVYRTAYTTGGRPDGSAQITLEVDDSPDGRLYLTPEQAQAIGSALQQLADRVNSGPA